MSSYDPDIRLRVGDELAVGGKHFGNFAETHGECALLFGKQSSVKRWWNECRQAMPYEALRSGHSKPERHTDKQEAYLSQTEVVQVQTER